MAVPRIWSKLIDKYQSWNLKESWAFTAKKAELLWKKPWPLLHNLCARHSLYSESKRQTRDKQTRTPPHSVLHSPKHSSAQASSLPPTKNTASKSQHCSLSCAAAPRELSVRNSKTSASLRAQKNQRHTRHPVQPASVTLGA